MMKQGNFFLAHSEEAMDISKQQMMNFESQFSQITMSNSDRYASSVHRQILQENVMDAINLYLHTPARNDQGLYVDDKEGHGLSTNEEMFWRNISCYPGKYESNSPAHSDVSSETSQTQTQAEDSFFGGDITSYDGLGLPQVSQQPFWTDNSHLFRLPNEMSQNDHSYRQKLSPTNQQHGYHYDIPVLSMGRENGVPVITVGSHERRKPTNSGTGVFTSSESISAAKFSKSPRSHSPPKVILPARIAKAFGLNVDEKNNVVHKRPVVAIRKGGKNGHVVQVAAPQMKVVSDSEITRGCGN